MLTKMVKLLFILLLATPVHAGKDGHLSFWKKAKKLKYKTLDFEKFSLVTTEEQRDESWNNGRGPLVNSSFQKKLDDITDSVELYGNDAQLLINGMQSYQARYHLIDKARKSITASFLSMEAKGAKRGKIKSKTIRKLLVKLLKARKRGVSVKIILDGATSFVYKTQKVVDKLVEAGAEVIKYNPISGKQEYDRFGWGLTYLHALSRIFTNNKEDTSILKNRWHDKIMVFDGKYAIVGGLNWGDNYGLGNAYGAATYHFDDFINRPLIKEIQLHESMTGWGEIKDRGWRDTDVLLKGPIVKALQTEYLTDFLLLKRLMKRKRNKWEKATESDVRFAREQFNELYQENHVYFEDKYPRSMNGKRIRRLSHRPFLYSELGNFKSLPERARKKRLYAYNDYPQATLTNYYVNMIDKAQHKILWGAFSIGPVNDVSRALVRAAKRGVKIYLVSNSKAAARHMDDKGIQTYGRNKRSYGQLIKKSWDRQTESSNIRIFEWQSESDYFGSELKSGAFHQKVLSIDGVLSVIGSYNMSSASARFHTEGAVAIVDPNFAREVEKMYTNDLLFTREVRIKKKFLLDDIFEPISVQNIITRHAAQKSLKVKKLKKFYQECVTPKYLYF